MALDSVAGSDKSNSTVAPQYRRLVRRPRFRTVAVRPLYYSHGLANETSLAGYGDEVDRYLFRVVGVFQAWEQIEKEKKERGVRQ